LKGWEAAGNHYLEIGSEIQQCQCITRPCDGKESWYVMPLLDASPLQVPNHVVPVSSCTLEGLTIMRRITVWLFMLAVAFALCAAQAKIEKKPAPYTSPNSGKEMYKAYCASCHGLDGKGTGPAAAAMKSPLPDLTLLSKNNGGKFPSDHVASVIQGDANSPSHGSSDMPVWGPVFMKVSQHHTAQVQQRVRNLTEYIESLQAK
jgi:mono/diheme cytochrome c family protein